eukprot:m.210983 g.210983  ORF g.210983 m.210983 type:complete len:803 (-) comp33097_c0_seq1:113-2521(-)
MGWFWEHVETTLKLARLPMTVFSAVTYGTATSMVRLDLSTATDFDVSLFVAGYVFMFSCQMVAHFLGEYYDLESDRLNVHSSKFTGGSKVLLSGKVSPVRALVYGYISLAIAAGVLFWHLPVRVLPIGIAMLLIAHQYSAKPFSLNHHGFGEIGATIVMNVLVPHFAALLQSNKFSTWVPLDSSLFILVIPAALQKFSLFLVLNLADQRPDWLANKRTIPVIFGEEFACELVALCTWASYVMMLGIYVMGFCDEILLVFMLMFFPDGYRIINQFSQKGPKDFNVLALQYLKLAPSTLVAAFMSCLVHEVVLDPLRKGNWDLGAGVPTICAKLFSLSLVVRVLPVLPFVLRFLIGAFALGVSPPPQTLSNDAVDGVGVGIGDGVDDGAGNDDKVIIVGGGVGGLVMALTLRTLGVPFEILENRSAHLVHTGADLAVWPPAIAALDSLGVGDDDWWESNSYRVDTVYMNNVVDQLNDRTLKKINMKNVTGSTHPSNSRGFRLISRKVLMSRLLELFGNDPNIIYDFHVGGANETSTGVEVLGIFNKRPSRRVGRIVVGADGINSKIRRCVTRGLDSPLRFCDEFCHQGIVDLRDDSADVHLRPLFEQREKEFPHSMTLSYTNGCRFSWGLIDGLGQTGYWFLKQADKTNVDFPEPIRLFANARAHSDHAYVHRIQDRQPLPIWSGRRMTLIGDACHSVTPNNGQGACMAIEDAFILCVLLKENWRTLDGCVQAFYEYERVRKPHTTLIHSESYKQMRIGQLRHPISVFFRNLALRVLPVQVLERNLRKTNFFEIKPWIVRFRTA